MKIAVNARILTANLSSGHGNFAHEILRRLTVNHPEHEFYFLCDSHFDQRFIYENNVKPVVLHPSFRHPLFSFWWYQVSLAKALKKINPDVFLAIDGLTTFRTAVPQVIVMRDIAGSSYSQDLNFLSRKYYNYYLPKVARIASEIITFSRFAQQEISHWYGIENSRISVVYQVPNPTFKPINFEQQVLVREQYTQGEAYFFCVSASQPNNNPENLYRAFDKFKVKTGSEVKLVVTNRAPGKPANKNKAYQQMQFKQDVIFTGRLPETEISRLYGAAVGIINILTDLVGLTVLEAQQCGCPVIAANTGALPEIAGNGAQFVNPLDTNNICDALINIYHYLEVRAALVKLGFENTQRFSWNQSTRAIMATLEEVVQAKQGKHARV